MQPAPLSTAALSPATQAIVRRLADRPWASEVYLAGSAALALHLSHRPVRDLDLMSGTLRMAPPGRRDLLDDLLALDPETRVETARDGYLSTRLADDVAVRFFWYPYPLVEPESEVFGLPVASLVDLGLMKIAAIISRGTRRDFLDLHCILREMSLEALLDQAPRKFGHVRDFSLQALKALADFSAAVEEPLPRLSWPITWEEVERYVSAEARRLGRRQVGLPEDGDTGHGPEGGAASR